jgi:hypothetical protein
MLGNLYIVLYYEIWNIYEFYNTQLSNVKCSENGCSLNLISWEKYDG